MRKFREEIKALSENFRMRIKELARKVQRGEVEQEAERKERDESETKEIEVEERVRRDHTENKIPVLSPKVRFKQKSRRRKPDGDHAPNVELSLTGANEAFNEFTNNSAQASNDSQERVRRDHTENKIPFLSPPKVRIKQKNRRRKSDGDHDPDVQLMLTGAKGEFDEFINKLSAQASNDSQESVRRDHTENKIPSLPPKVRIKQKSRRRKSDGDHTADAELRLTRAKEAFSEYLNKLTQASNDPQIPATLVSNTHDSTEGLQQGTLYIFGKPERLRANDEGAPKLGTTVVTEHDRVYYPPGTENLTANNEAKQERERRKIALQTLADRAKGKVVSDKGKEQADEPDGWAQRTASRLETAKGKERADGLDGRAQRTAARLETAKGKGRADEPDGRAQRTAARLETAMGKGRADELDGRAQRTAARLETAKGKGRADEPDGWAQRTAARLETAKGKGRADEPDGWAQRTAARLETAKGKERADEPDGRAQRAAARAETRTEAIDDKAYYKDLRRAMKLSRAEFETRDEEDRRWH